MQHNEAGETVVNSALYPPDWHKALSEKRLMAYVRHAYIWRSTGAVNKSSREQTKLNPRWDGGQDAYGVKFTAVWPRIARLIRALDADPGIWVAAHFSPSCYGKFLTQKGSFEVPDITPSNLCSKVSETIYNEYCSNFPKTAIDAYNTAGRSIALRLRSLQKLDISDADRNLCVLHDEGYVTATPFLRQGFANGLNVPDVIDSYLRPAAFDFESKQRLYERVIPEFMPAWLISDKLVEAVNAIRVHWSKYE